jgi:hypothetical protein
MRKSTLLFIGLVLIGCPKKPLPTGGAADPTPIIIVGLDTGAQLSAASGKMAEESEDYVGCIVGSVLSTALETAKEGVEGNLDGGLLPAVDMDISGCLPLAEKMPEGQDVPAIVQPIFDMALQASKAAVAVYGGDMACAPKAWTMAGLEYAQGLVPVVIAEVASPDGVLSIPEVAVDLAPCAPPPEPAPRPEPEGDDDDSAE